MSKLLSEASINELETALKIKGCAVVVIAPCDVMEQWKINQDADEKDEIAPTDCEIHSVLRLIQCYLEKTIHENDPCFEWGAISDACEIISNWRKEIK